MLEPINEMQKKLIVRNVLSACKDISKLNKRGYNYINLCSGFIAHYDIWGFRQYYSDYSLKQDILRNEGMNQWRNFRPGEKNYEYYKSKADVYNLICNQLK
jgi:hypothetical protein